MSGVPVLDVTSPWARGALLVACVLLFTGLSFTFPLPPDTRDEDTSVHRVWAEFLFEEKQVGVDYVFAYGPLAATIRPAYDPAFNGRLLGLVLFFRLLGASVLVGAVFAKARGRADLIITLMILAVLLPAATWDLLPYVLLSACYGLLFFLPSGAKVPEFFLLCYSWSIALVKFTLFPLSVAFFSLLLIERLGRSKRDGFTSVALFVVAFIVVWKACGQDLENVWSYVVASIRYSSGYIESASSGGSIRKILVEVISWGLLLIRFAWSASYSWRSSGFWVLWGMVFSSTFVVWKAGQVVYGGAWTLPFLFLLFLVLPGEGRGGRQVCPVDTSSTWQPWSS